VVVARPTKIISLLKSEEQEWNNAPKDFLMNKVLYYGVLAIQEELVLLLVKEFIQFCSDSKVIFFVK
jgi:hypothetical protein